MNIKNIILSLLRKKKADAQAPVHKAQQPELKHKTNNMKQTRQQHQTL